VHDQTDAFYEQRYKYAVRLDEIQVIHSQLKFLSGHTILFSRCRNNVMNASMLQYNACSMNTGDMHNLSNKNRE
jgi:hypothetical protein